MPPVPKSAATRQRRNRSATSATIEAPAATRVDLDGEHHPRTLAWWESIWSSPISAEWVDADVPGLVALAALWDEFWAGGDRAKTAAEIRMQSREFGLSPLARRSLQWEVKRVQAVPGSPVTPTRRSSGRATLSILDGTKRRSA